jgi:hypothetical protein
VKFTATLESTALSPRVRSYLVTAIFRENIFQKALAYLTRFAKGKADKALQTGT